MYKYKYLYKVDSPEDLRSLDAEQLRVYSDELRNFIIGHLSANPGHLGSSLGVVELTTALHYVYNTPQDKLVWDVGHQAYAHKIITGRRDVFHTNRKLGGISGFPKIAESQYDAFGVGHASTSISAALGIATASTLKGEKRDVVAIIGDGALSGGLAFEGLNNAGASNTDILVILNDNKMSIDPNVGALKEYLLKMTTSKGYNLFKSRTWTGLEKMPRLRRAFQKLSNAVKLGLLQQSNLFEGLNFRYFGPVDGHDLGQLTRVLSDLKEIPGPKMLHVLTVKGKGYKPAEENQQVWHAPGVFNALTGERPRGKVCTAPLYQEVFGHTILELAQQNDRIVGVTPAMPTGCSLDIMMDKMPHRCFDVGIAEGHAVTFSAGMATDDIVPFCNIYSSFMQRAYDNFIHDVALQGLNVVMCLDRAGLVGEDGATHHGAYDIAAMLPIPNVTVAAPMNEVELRNLMYTASLGRGAFVIRYPRGRGVTCDWRVPFEELPIGESRLLREGRDVAVLSLGHVGNAAAEAIEVAAAGFGAGEMACVMTEGDMVAFCQSEEIDRGAGALSEKAEAASRFAVEATHVDLRFAKPLDQQMLHKVCSTHKRIITVEDGVIKGGVGSAVLDFVNKYGYDCHVQMLGIPDQFIEHGTQDELKAICGFDTKAILEAVRG